MNVYIQENKGKRAWTVKYRKTKSEQSGTKIDRYKRYREITEKKDSLGVGQMLDTKE